MCKDENLEFDFDAVFNVDDYLHFYGDRLDDECTDIEVNFLKDKLQLHPKMQILDLACGFGRHANRLAEAGHYVTGMDRSEGFLELARNAAPENTHISYICKDMRELDFENRFDRVLMMFTAFGYFSDDENLKVLKNISKALKPGGLLCMDYPNRDTLLKNMLPSQVLTKGDDLMVERSSFDPMTGRLYNKRFIIRDGKRKDMPYFIRLYNATETIALLKEAGMELVKIYGGYRGTEFSSQSFRMVVVARKV
jgi:SAM-dependent methyltransferase